MSFKNSLVTIFAFICLILIVYYLYNKYSMLTVEYSGLGESEIQQAEVKNNIFVTDEVMNSDKIEFVQRKITGGGINPGWVISLLETQPNIFTGRVIVDDGIYQHPVTLREEVTNIFAGEMKSTDGKKEVFSMKKTPANCKDEEENIFEYTLNGTYGGTQFSGCGGEAIKIAE